MSDYLVDNATLSGVQRLLGQSQTLNLYNIDSDICCFEKFVSAIIFGEKLLAIDDYKANYRDARLKSFPYVNFISPKDLPYGPFSVEAAEFAASTAFAFEGSKPVGEALAFFETLRIDPQMRWNVFGSSEYLTLSYLVTDPRDGRHESAISAAFGNESGDLNKSNVDKSVPPSMSIGGRQVDDLKEFVQQFSEGNPNYSGTGSNDTLSKVVYGYGWVAERSYFYSNMATHLGALCALSPLRDAFCEASYRIDHRRDLNTVVSELAKNGQQAVSSIVSASGEAKFAMRLPFFTAYLLSKTDNISQAIDLAFNMKNDQDVASCRGLLGNLQHLDRLDRISEVNSLLKYLNEEVSNLLKKFHVTTDQGTPLGLSVGFSGISLDANMALGKLFRHHKHKPFGKVFRSMARDMMMTERLGALHDKATLFVREHKDAMYVRPSFTPDYMEHKSSEYGRPAVPRAE